MTDGKLAPRSPHLLIAEQQDKKAIAADISDRCADNLCRERVAAFYKMSDVARKIESITTRTMLIQSWVNKAIWYNTDKEKGQLRPGQTEFNQSYVETLTIGDGTCFDFAGIKDIAHKLALTPADNVLLVNGNVVDVVNPRDGFLHAVLAVYDPVEHRNMISTVYTNVDVESGKIVFETVEQQIDAGSYIEPAETYLNAISVNGRWQPAGVSRFMNTKEYFEPSTGEFLNGSTVSFQDAEPWQNEEIIMNAKGMEPAVYDAVPLSKRLQELAPDLRDAVTELLLKAPSLNTHYRGSSSAHHAALTAG